MTDGPSIGAGGSEAEPLVRAVGLRKDFGDLRAVDGVSLDLPAGRTTGLLGPNGAGKTTTIRLLAGVLEADAGRVEFEGGGSPGDRDVRRRLGVAPQAISVYEELTGAENLRFCGRLYGLSGARLRERVDWCLEFVELTDRGHDPVGEYSGGMKRRLNLACALVHDPAILFLDEPTLGIDPQSRSHIFDRVRTLQEAGRTLLYTTHDMEAAERMCDRVAIMDEGRILALDTVTALLDAHGAGMAVSVELSVDAEPPDTVEGDLEGSTLRFEGASPIAVLRRLEEANVPYRSFRVEKPDLESVFLSLTGRALRD